MIEKIFIQQSIKRIELEQFLRRELEKAGFTRLELVKTPLVTRIVVHLTHPGLAIGKGGQNIRSLTKEIEEKFHVENPQLEIREIAVPQLDAQAMADTLSNLIERGYSWRSVAYKIVRDITNAKALGVEIIISGKLGGKGARKKKQRIAEGYMKKAGNQVTLVDYGMKTSYPRQGAIGIKVKIIRPDVVFPDKIKISDIIEKKKEAEREQKEKSSKAEIASAEKQVEIAEETVEKAEEKPDEQKKEIGKGFEKEENETEKKGEKEEGKAKIEDETNKRIEEKEERKGKIEDETNKRIEEKGEGKAKNDDSKLAEKKKISKEKKEKK